LATGERDDFAIKIGVHPHREPDCPQIAWVTRQSAAPALFCFLHHDIIKSLPPPPTSGINVGMKTAENVFMPTLNSLEAYRDSRRFADPAQSDLDRKERLELWFLQMVVEDRSETAMPPAHLSG
jgi:hypothetical protein